MTRARLQHEVALFDKLKVEFHASREAAAEAAANSAAEALRTIASARRTFGVIFATGDSQLATLRALRRINELPWGQVQGFHMDDYVGLPDDHPASFHAYLRDNVPGRSGMKSFLEMDGAARDIDKMCRDYAAALRAADPQLCLLGIGENGHLAFNDPAEADFNDPSDIRVVHLDRICRLQQVSEGWFKTYEDVPKLAVTLTIPAIFRVPKLIISVPGKRKASVVRRTVLDPVSSVCPSTILRMHPDATVYLDEESSAEITELIGNIDH